MKKLIPIALVGLFAAGCGGGAANTGATESTTPQISEQEKQEMQTIEAKTAEMDALKEDIKKSSANLDTLLKGL